MILEIATFSIAPGKTTDFEAAYCEARKVITRAPITRRGSAIHRCSRSGVGCWARISRQLWWWSIMSW